MNVSSIGSYVQRALNLYPTFVLGTGNEVFEKALQETVKNRGTQSYFSAVWDGTKKGVRAAENFNNTKVKARGGFLQSTWKDFCTTPDVVKAGWKLGGQKAAAAGKTGLGKFWSQFKGSLAGLGKRMPLVGTILAVGCEIPNLYSAFKDNGLVGGLIETGKTGLRLGAGMTGAAIGQALIPIPIVGGLIGYFAGDWLMSKFTGKSHSEKKAEAQQQQNVQQQIPYDPYDYIMNRISNQYPLVANNQMATMPQMTMTPQQISTMGQMLYGAGNMNDDFMANVSGINRLNYMG